MNNKNILVAVVAAGSLFFLYNSASEPLPSSKAPRIKDQELSQLMLRVNNENCAKIRNAVPQDDLDRALSNNDKDEMVYVQEDNRIKFFSMPLLMGKRAYKQAKLSEARQAYDSRYVRASYDGSNIFSRRQSYMPKMPFVHDAELLADDKDNCCYWYKKDELKNRMIELKKKKPEGLYNYKKDAPLSEACKQEIKLEPTLQKIYDEDFQSNPTKKHANEKNKKAYNDLVAEALSVIGTSLPYADTTAAPGFVRELVSNSTFYEAVYDKSLSRN